MKLYKRLSVLLSMGIMVIGLTTFTTGEPGAYAETRLGADSFFGDGSSYTDDEGRTLQSDAQGDAGIYDGYAAGQATVPGSTQGGSTQTGVMPGVSGSQAGDDHAATEQAQTSANRLTMISEDSDIYRLIRRYLDAKLVGTRDAFNGIVTDPELIDIASMSRTMEAIVAFDDLVCYTKHGSGSIDYVVFYTYDMDIVTIKTPLNSMDMLCVSYDADGDPLIFVGELDDHTSGMIREMIGDDDVRALIDEANSKMENAMMSDEGLRAFWERLNAAA